MVPLRVDNGRLIIAMSEPNNTYARSDLTISAGYPMTPVIVAEDAVTLLQARLFGFDLDPAKSTPATRASSASPESGPQGGTVVDVPADGRVTERVEPGAQPEVDPGEAGTNPAVPTYEVGAGRKPKGHSVRGRVGSKGKIGDILITEGKITGEQLEQALSMQKNDPRDSGKILVSLGYVLPADLAQALAKRLKLDYVVITDLSEGEVDPEALNLIGEETMRKYTALPLRFENGRLVVAIADPNDIFALEDLRIIAKHPVTPVVATEEDLCGAFAHLFGSDDGLYPEDECAATALVEPDPIPPEEEYGADGHADENTQGTAAGPVEKPADEPAENGNVRGNNGALAPLGDVVRGKRVTIGGGKIEDILVSHGNITDEQLEHALMVQKDDPREIGQVLVSLGYIGKADLARALAQRLRLDYVELTERDVDKSVVNLVDQKVLRKYGAVPVSIENNRLVVAMSDPTNFYALEDLMMISGYPITPVVALEEDIRRVHNKVFAMSEEISEFLEEAKTGPVERDHGELDLGVDAGPDEAPIIKLVSSILQQAVGDGASDIHIEPQAGEVAVRMRVDGVLRESMSIPPKLQNGVIARPKIVSNLNTAEKRLPQDGRFPVRLGGTKIDLRVVSLPTVYGEKIVLRLLDTSNSRAELPELGFPPKVYEKYEEIFCRPYGAILVTGPTGSGKSTTLYAMLSELNTPEKNIITVEDPVEYRMRGINQIQTNSKAGLNFAGALKSILRADPDIVMIGEVLVRRRNPCRCTTTRHSRSPPGGGQRLPRTSDHGLRARTAPHTCVVCTRG